MRIVLATLALSVLGTVAFPVVAQELVLEGAVAYSDVLRYDYKGDGNRSPVRFWMEFDAQSAKGQPGTSDYQPASGSMRYFLRDEDDGTKVMKWRRGLDMEGTPKDVPFPMSDIEFDGKTVKFDAFGMRWTITDGGDDYRSDRITVNDGFRTSTITKLYAGDLWVGPAK
jgi:hypothetical protein